MKEYHTSIRVVQGEEINFTEEARRIQGRALQGEACVVRLDQIIFFSSESGDAWMLEPREGYAACLARNCEPRSIPIRETNNRFEVEWNSDYSIVGGAFSVRERGGAMRTIHGYPTAEINRLLSEFPDDPGPDSAGLEAARRRPKTGRNEPCPCGSGKKYKKCCLERDESLFRQEASANGAQSLRYSEAGPSLPPRASLDFGKSPLGDEADIPGDDDIELPETERKLTKLWDEFEALEHPSPEQADAFVTSLLAFSTEPDLWMDALHLLARHEHIDFTGVFRRIADAVPHTEKTGVSFFYWAAVEAFVGRGEPQRLPEVAARFRLLDGRSYSADALAHLQEYLLAEGFEEEALGLAEHFMPIMRADDDLMPYALAKHGGLIFELRVGRCFREEPSPGSKPESLAKKLRHGIEEEIHEKAALNAADVITGQAGMPEWTLSDFALVSMESLESDKAWQQFLRLSRVLMHVARDAFRVQGLPPGRILHGLMSFHGAIQQRSDSRRKKGRGKARFGNLLDFLRPSGIEERLVRTCRDLVGINKPRARMLLEAHETLLHAAVRHRLISVKDAARTQEELDRLKSAVRKSSYRR